MLFFTQCRQMTLDWSQLKLSSSVSLVIYAGCPLGPRLGCWPGYLRRTCACGLHFLTAWSLGSKPGPFRGTKRRNSQFLRPEPESSASALFRWPHGPRARILGVGTDPTFWWEE